MVQNSLKMGYQMLHNGSQQLENGASNVACRAMVQNNLKMAHQMTRYPMSMMSSWASELTSESWKSEQLSLELMFRYQAHLNHHATSGAEVVDSIVVSDASASTTSTSAKM